MSATEQRYVAPEFGADAFNCPQAGCGAYAHQNWYPLKQALRGNRYLESDAHVSRCSRCGKDSYWLNGRLIDPPAAPAPLPHPEMPSAVREDYLEAREVVAISPRSTCALLRLGLQKLCGELGESGKNINDDIKALVAKGLPVEVQQALDSLRVFGNNALHPGELDLKDDSETAQALFGVMNYIVEQRIAQPKKLEALYAKLPAGAREAIERRDGVPEQESGEASNGPPG